MLELRSHNEVQIKCVEAAFSTVIEGASAIYLSAPITTGPRHIEWLRHVAEESFNSDEPRTEEWHERVLSPNIAAASIFASRLRNLKGKVVINPADLKSIAGWTQIDYYILWKAVLQQHVTEMWMLNGWHLSRGCAYESSVALAMGLPVFNEVGVRMDVVTIANSILEAIRLMAELEIDTTFHRQVHNCLISTRS